MSKPEYITEYIAKLEKQNREMKELLVAICEDLIEKSHKNDEVILDSGLWCKLLLIEHKV